MKSINRLLLCITFVSAQFTLRTENLDKQIDLKNKINKTVAAPDKGVPTGTTTNIATGTTGSTGHNFHGQNHGSAHIDPQTIITTIEDIITIVEAVSSFIHTMIPTSTTTTTTSTGKLELLNNLSNFEIETLQKAHDLLKTGILKIFEDEEKN